MALKAGEELNRAIWKIVHDTPAIDLFTQLDEAALLSSQALEVDALLGNGSVLSTLFRRDPRSPDNPLLPLSPKKAAELPQAVRAEMVWHRCFQTGAPLCEVTREVLTGFGLLGVGATNRDLSYYREAFRKFIPQELALKVIQTSNLSALTLRRDFFSTEEAPLPNKLGAIPLYRCLGLDALGANWERSCSRLKDSGVALKKSLDRESVNLLRGMIQEKHEHLHAQLFSFTVARPQELTQKKSGATRLLTKCVLPVCREHGIPLLLRLAGRGVDFAALQDLCEEFPEVTLLLCGSGAEQLAAGLELAREFPQVHPLTGCGLMASATAMQNAFRQGLELLGGSFPAYASGAEHLLQLPGRWAHARWLLGESLQERYAALARTGWTMDETDLKREVESLLCTQAMRTLRAQTMTPEKPNPGQPTAK